MSANSVKVLTAFYTKTNVSAVVGSGKLSGIYEGKAPANTAYPFGIFNWQGWKPIEYTMGLGTALEYGFLQMRVYAENQKQAEDLLNVWAATLGNALTISGGTVSWLARAYDLPPNDQQINDRYVFGRGTLIGIGIE